jgi:hypothetical protein
MRSIGWGNMTGRTRRETMRNLASVGLVPLVLTDASVYRASTAVPERPQTPLHWLQSRTMLVFEDSPDRSFTRRQLAVRLSHLERTSPTHRQLGQLTATQFQCIHSALLLTALSGLLRADRLGVDETGVTPQYYRCRE